MQDLISRQAAIDALYDWSEHSMTDAEAWHIKQVIGDIKSMPPVQPKPKPECSCEQIKWERDMAIAQLKELGYGLGEKPRTGQR